MQDTRLTSLSYTSWRSSVVEQLTCNQQVGGSTPFASSILKMQDTGCRMRNSGEMEDTSCVVLNKGEVAEWTKAADCKSAGASLRRFESFPPHSYAGLCISDFGSKKLFSFAVRNPQSAIKAAGVAQLARASAFQAEGRGFESRLPLLYCQAHVAQAVEHILGKDVVGGSSPPVGSFVYFFYWSDNYPRR